MKLEITIGNQQIAFLVAFVSIIIVLGIAGAYKPSGSGGNPSTMGHSVDEMDWSQTIPSIKTNSMCLSGVCKSNWVAIYNSGWFPAANAVLYTRQHGLGAVPDVVQLWYSNTSDGSGDVVSLGGSPYAGSQGATIIDVDSQIVSTRGQVYLARYYDASGRDKLQDSGYLKIIAIKFP